MISTISERFFLPAYLNWRYSSCFQITIDPGSNSQPGLIFLTINLFPEWLDLILHSYVLYLPWQSFLKMTKPCQHYQILLYSLSYWYYFSNFSFIFISYSSIRSQRNFFIPLSSLVFSTFCFLFFLWLLKVSFTPKRKTGWGIYLYQLPWRASYSVFIFRWSHFPFDTPEIYGHSIEKMCDSDSHILPTNC